MSAEMDIFEKRIIFLFMRIVFVIIPAVVVFGICLQQHISVGDFSVAVNDEVGWYNQIFAVVKFGKPLGFWGYNGTHAEVGTFGPWGVAIVYFMSFFMKLISPFVDIYSKEWIFIVNNLMWACSANLFFILLAKPNGRQQIKLIIVYALLFVNHCYMFVGMSEIIRFSMGIILAGLIIFLLHRRTCAGYEVMLYFVAPIIILLFMSAYIMYGLVVPVWVYCVYKTNPRLKKYGHVWFVIGLLTTFMTTFVIFYINNLFSSPYITSAVVDLLDAFRPGIANGVRYVATYIAQNLKGCDISFILSTKKEFGGFFCFYLPFFYGLWLYLVVSFLPCWKKTSTHDIELHIIGTYLIIAFFCSFLVLYSTYYWTLIRGINIPLIMVLYLLCMKEKDTDIKIIVPFMVLGIYPFMLVANSTFIAERVDRKEPFVHASVFNEHILVSEDSSPWENTIACYGDVKAECIKLPVGLAINHMISCEPNKNAKYVMIWKNALENVGATQTKINDVQKNMEQTHIVVFEDSELVLMINSKSE